MTWTPVTDESTTYERPADIDNKYVVVRYVQNGYILPEQVWSSADDAGTVWA